MMIRPEPIQPWISTSSTHGSPSWTVGSVGSTAASHITEDVTSENSQAPIASTQAAGRNTIPTETDNNSPNDSSNNDSGALRDILHRFLYWLVLSPQTRQADAEQFSGRQGKTIRNYQKFTGDTMFLFGGRMMTSKGKPLSFTIVSIVLIAGGLFFGFIGSWVWHNVSPAVTITFAYIYFFALCSFVKASTTNPGVSSRKSFWHMLTKIDSPTTCSLS